MNQPSADKVLVVDDDFRTRFLSRSALEPAGFEVTDVASGKEALELLDSYTPDLILLDVIMPVMDGFQTCRVIRNHPTGADIPVLMITGLDDMETITDAYEAGATDFLLKPVQWPVLPRKAAFIIRSSRTTKALKESETRFRSIMELTPSIAVQGYRLDGTTTYWNRFSETLYGYTREEVIGQNLLDLIIPAGMREDVKGAMAWMVENKQPIPSAEMELMRKDGSLVSVFSSHALLHPPGQQPELFCMDLDLTPLKQTEQELRQAKDVAESASQAKSDFLSTMSHEMRTPLSALIGNLELLAETPLVPQQEQYLQDCTTASKMLLQVINDVLDFSKIEAGKIELTEQPFSIAALGRQLVRIFLPSARKKELEIGLLLGSELPEFIRADQLRVSQIISNLLSNAIKFTHQGKVMLEITCEPMLTQTSTQTQLLINVHDTGIGIAGEEQEKIFDGFSQLESFGTRHFAGTGLGLAISKRLAELMGGRISLTSIPGQGSVFHVWLPASICEAPDLELHKQKPAFTPSTILLADDDDLGRSVMTSLLKGRGHRVTAVANGAQLLDQLSANSFDVVLTDISMPDIDGIQVTQIIRSGKRAGINPRIPIVAMTAHAFSKDRDMFLEAGIDGFAAKPVDVEALLILLENLCSKQPDTLSNA
ncbi:MAG: response regulator [Geobacter sp.]|nr:response regulator [Geobacter sp.]